MRIPRARLPWAAQMELGEAGIAAARRRGDAGLLEQQARLAGCVRELTLVGSVGRLPNLDLDTQEPPVGPPRPVRPRWCRSPCGPPDSTPTGSP